ncbi:MAG: thioredoxin fold domain-containing protein [Sedimenticola sp.]
MKPTLPRLKILLLMLLFTPLTASTADDHVQSSLPEVTVEEASDLMSDGATAKQEREVIMVLVSQEHCPFCEDIKQDVIRPMIRGEDFKGNLMIRELSIDGGVEVKDFSGVVRSGRDLAADYNAHFTPTLLFLSPNGHALNKSIIGYTTPAFFYYYVEEAIKNSIISLNSSGK